MLKKDITLNATKFNEEIKIKKNEKKKEKNKNKFRQSIIQNYLLLSSLRLILMFVAIIASILFGHTPFAFGLYIFIFASSVIFVIFNKYTTKTTQICDIAQCFLWSINIINHCLH